MHGADFYQLNVFEGSDLNKQITNGKVSAAACSKAQAHMFAFAKDFLEKRGYKGLNVFHWSKNNRERSLYNTLAKSGTTIFPFGSGAGGFIDGYAVMLHRALQPYEMMIKAGQKPLMVLMKESRLQPIAACIKGQLEYGRFNIAEAASLDKRLEELSWLYDLWEKYGLVKNNGVLYELTTAGQFWKVNITQTTLECMQYLITGENVLALEKIAQQDIVKVDAARQAMQELKEA